MANTYKVEVTKTVDGGEDGWWERNILKTLVIQVFI
jgi:hypothetical protein